MMKPDKVLVLCKRSALKIYFLEPKSSFFGKQSRLNADNLKQFKMAHEDHYRTLELVERVLREKRITFVKRWRGTKTRYSEFDFIITVGGDGTFLEAARNVGNQTVLGVNSDPSRSVGRFCCATSENFSKVLTEVLNGHIKPKRLRRLSLRLPGFPQIDFANDILICHRNPAAMSRYLLCIGANKEQQRSSGVWIATAPGSSGAIHSAGGKLFDFFDKKAQYFVRELHQKKRIHSRLQKGILHLRTPMTIESLMRNGMIYVDGAHHRFPFQFGDVAEVTFSKNDLHIIHS